MSENKIMLIAIISILVCVSIYVIYRILRNPFRYPYFSHSFDVTGKRSVYMEDYIDNFLCDDQNWYEVLKHEQYIRQWKKETINYIQDCKLKKRRARQYQEILDDESAYFFATVRNQTRYRQRNYVKTAYTIGVTDSEWAVDWQWLGNRRKQLEKIGFQATLRDYNSKNQRKLMTPALRRRIMERDNYTCQNCGKYMPDEVGLHIDHIIPIAKGGKSIPSNLRVLCSKCNGHKGAK